MITGKVVHCKKEKYEVYIGRPSIFGNPFEIGKDGDRDEVCDKYEIYVRDRIKKDRIFRNQIKNLKGKTLGCWCSPKRCHGEILIRLSEEINDR